MVGVIESFVRLRWRLLRGSLRGSGPERAGVVVSTVASALVGFGLAATLAIAGRRDDIADLFVLACVGIAVGVLGISVVAGVTQPIDPRVLAIEPLSDAERGVGLLAAAAVGPPGIAGALMGMGLAFGAWEGPASAVVVGLGVLAWLATLLLVSRTAANLLGLLANRHPRTGQVLVGLGGLVFYGLFQFVPSILASLDDGDRGRLSDVLALTPPGQIGRALENPTDVVRGLGHVFLGALAVPVLVTAFTWSTAALATSTRRLEGGSTGTTAPGAVRRLARWACGRGGAGAVAWRSVLTRFRTPRTALETFTGAGVGLAAVLVPTLARDGIGGGAVLVGGAVQLAVLFMAGNSFGSDGPALVNELLAGAGPSDLAGGKARSILVVASPIALVGPLIAAAVTAEWQYLPAGLLVGAGGLLAGTGGAIVQSTIVPVAIPESENPFAAGESGRGIMAALLLGGVLIALALVTLPVALALLWANSRSSVPLVTTFGLATLLVGWMVMRGGVAFSARHLRERGPEFVTAITPAR